MQNSASTTNAQARTVVVLGTGGTIAGTAASSEDNLGYRAATVGVEALLAAVPALRDVPLQAEQVAQLDSKDMDFVTWQRLAQRTAAHLARPEVAGVVITHGTDTLEETAYFLGRVLMAQKPVVLTAAMRPATSLQADGPQNLFDAVSLARQPGVQGVLVLMQGQVLDGLDVRKQHTYRLDAFAAGDAGLLAHWEAGQLRQHRAWPAGAGLGLACIGRDPSVWPRVEIVLNHAGADGRLVDALLQQGLQGLVLAGTGNGTLSLGLEAAALRAQAAGVQVLRASRCAAGLVQGIDSPLPSAGALSAVQARVELLLRCLSQPLP
jgi:L-asparaginase